MKATSKVRTIHVDISAEVLESVFEECDRYDRDETGGRVVGHFSVDSGTLALRATAVIEPGPNARRTNTSFFQDGDYQTEVFRRLEADDASIEHLGNWHTHHVNGYPTLSSGDLATYRRIVNHELHNTDFFYALLVTHRKHGRTGLERYAVRHFVFFRGDDAVHEVTSGNVRVTDEPQLWPRSDGASAHVPTGSRAQAQGTRRTVAIRARDQSVLRVLGPSFEPRLTAQSGMFFWKGPLSLVDGSVIDVKVVEVESEDGLHYYPILAGVSGEVAKLCETPFRSACEAVRALELRMNQEIYESAVTGGEG